MRAQQNLLAVIALALSTCLFACGSSDGQGSKLPVAGLNAAPGTTQQAAPTTSTAGSSSVSQPPTTMTMQPTASGGAPAVVKTPPMTGAAGTSVGASGAAAPPGGATGMGGQPAGTASATAGGRPVSPYSLYDATTNTLAAPAQGAGVQIKTTPFDLQPGDERFTCYHAEIPVDGEIDVGYYESLMAKGSHHFILYQTDGDTTPDGTMDNTGCLTGFMNWIYSSAQPHIDLQIPQGVAFKLGSRQRVVFDMHYINTTTGVLHAGVTLNITFAKGQFQQAASLISYNTQIYLQPNQTQTVGGDCTPGAGAKFFYFLTHTHRRGQVATITRVKADGSMGEELVHSSDWEVPDEKIVTTDPYVTFQPGEKFHYSCSYMNDLDQVVTAGPSAQTNEMCMAITYYFPASAGGSCF